MQFLLMLMFFVQYMVVNRYEDNIKFKNLVVTQFFLQEICLVICIAYFISLWYLFI